MFFVSFFVEGYFVFALSSSFGMQTNLTVREPSARSFLVCSPAVRQAGSEWYIPLSNLSVFPADGPEVIKK